MSVNQFPKRTVVLTVAALVAIASLTGGALWYDKNYAAPERLERRYLAAQQAIKTARADLFRSRQECRAKAIEFDHKASRECITLLQTKLEITTAVIASNREAISKMEQMHCPGMKWCPYEGGNPFDQFDTRFRQPNPFDQFDTRFRQPNPFAQFDPPAKVDP